MKKISVIHISYRHHICMDVWIYICLSVISWYYLDTWVHMLSFMCVYFFWNGSKALNWWWLDKFSSYLQIWCLVKDLWKHNILFVAEQSLNRVKVLFASCISLPLGRLRVHCKLGENTARIAEPEQPVGYPITRGGKKKEVGTSAVMVFVFSRSWYKKRSAASGVLD